MRAERKHWEAMLVAEVVVDIAVEEATLVAELSGHGCSGSNACC